MTTATPPTPRTNRKYGWLPDLPDNRDKVWTPPTSRRGVMPKLPTSVDLRITPYEPPIYDQSQLGSCTANGVADIFEFAQRKQGLLDYMPSRLFIYYEERRIINSLSYDSGAFIRDGLKVVNRLGAPHETLWPYSLGAFTQAPPQDAYDDGLNHQAIQYAAIDNKNQVHVKQSLAQGFPVVIGFTVYPWFESPVNGSCTPVPNQQVLGGHCTVIVGYEHIKGSRQVWAIVRNSWGTGWGDRGYCYIPMSWLCNYSNADDFWVITSVEG